VELAFLVVAFADAIKAVERAMRSLRQPVGA
jgi:hypothetical protein